LIDRFQGQKQDHVYQRETTIKVHKFCVKNRSALYTIFKSQGFHIFVADHNHLYKISKNDIMKVTGLYIYPIKSISGISLSSSVVMERGLQYDRRWMLVDENNKFISQRQHIEMALLQPEIVGDQLRISHKTKDIPPLSFDLNPDLDKEKITVSIWNDVISALRMEDACGAWFSEVLDMKCELVYMPDEVQTADWTARQTSTGEGVSFADGYPLLVLGTASVADFNTRLDNPVQAANFRPNILVESTTPYEEESWKRFTIGQQSFEGIRACGRCQVIGFDQEKATNDPAVLKTLSTYRKVGNKVLFGLNAVFRGESEELIANSKEQRTNSRGQGAIINVGDELSL
jgi:hypothetical protein